MNEKDNTVRIVSAVADKTKAVLYKEDGDTIIIHQGDHRLKALLDEIIPITTRGQVAVVSLDKFSVYADFEKKTGGMVRLFRVAKNKLKSWFGGDDGQEVIIQLEPPVDDANPAPVPDKIQPSLDTIRGDLQPIPQNDVIESTDTVVAVVNNKLIPDIDKIRPMIQHAARNNSTKAVENFLHRLTTIIDRRQHSVEDMFRFLEKADLPLAEDGSIIAYKILKKREGVFVDCHTGRVRQRVGSYVCVDENLVDLNRRNECSNGLHIARRGYIGSFGGDVCVLCKIDPEDVMVVPHNDANKIRVKGYHILAELSQGAYEILKQNRAMTTDMESLRAVFEAIKGNHIGRIERVEIKGQSGTNVVITPLSKGMQKPQISTSKDSVNGLNTAAAFDDDVNISASVQPRDINKQVNDEYSKIQNENLDQEDESSGIEEDDDDGDLKDICDECGVEVEDGEDLCESCLDIATAPDIYTDAGFPEEAHLNLPKEADEVDQEDLEAAAEFHDEVVKPLKEEAKDGSQAFILYGLWKAHKTKATWDTLISFKKKQRKSWEKLGLTEEQIQDIKLRQENGPEPEPKKAEKAPKPKAGTKKKEAPKPAEKVSQAVVRNKKGQPSNLKTSPATKAEKLQALYTTWARDNSQQNLQAIVTFKKQAKKSWEALGFSPAQINSITKALK